VPADRGRLGFFIVTASAEQIADDLIGLLPAYRHAAVVERAFTTAVGIGKAG
jgi:hypothetical protein